MYDEAPDGDWSGQQGWQLVDTRVMRQHYPYTYFVPSRAEIDALTPGDAVKLEFCDALCAAKPRERMWVVYKGRDALGWFGTLSNQPSDLPGLQAGQMVRFLSHHIAGVFDQKIDTSEDEERFFAQAMIDRRILDEGAPIARMERLRPWRKRVGGYENTGWHVFADAPGKPLLERLEIGLLLNRDDRMLHLLDAPFGACIWPQRDGSYGLSRP